jgi:hypothetical protein
VRSLTASKHVTASVIRRELEVQVEVALEVAVDLIHLLALTLFRQTSSSRLIASMPPAMILRSI